MATSRALVEEIVRLRQTQDRIERRLDDTNGGRVPTEAETRAMVEHQGRFDDVYRGLELGGAPPPRGQGESPSTYRRRLVEGLLRYSKDWSTGTRIYALPESTIPIVEAAVIADAQKLVADRTVGSFRHPNQMRTRKVPDQSGREWTEYHGPTPLAWMSQFMLPGRRLVQVRHPVSDRVLWPQRWR